MNSWFQHAHIDKIQSGIIGKRLPPGVLHGVIEQVLLDGKDHIDLKDKATGLFFDLVDYDPYERWTGLQEFLGKMRLWSVRHSSGPTQDTAEKTAELYAMRHSPDGWKQLDRIFNELCGMTLSGIADTMEIFHHAEDPGLHEPEMFSLSMRVVAHDLVNGFSIIPWKAVASQVDLILPFADQVVASQAEAFRQGMSYPSDHDLDYYVKVSRAKPADLLLIKGGRTILEIPVVKDSSQALFDLDWVRTKFTKKDRALVAAVAAVAPASAANKLKARHLEDELGL
jgi:hypothetical protein